MARVLVTGGTGFIGRVLVKALIERGDEVSVLSRSKPHEATNWIRGDITTVSDVDQCLSIQELDAIYHLASLPGDTGDPRQMVDVNIVGLTNMLRMARKSNVRRFVHSSSISAYEWYPATKFRPPLAMPVKESHPCRPQDMYATTKLMQEQLVTTYQHQYELETAILRVTAVIGPDGSGGGQMWRDFADQIQQGAQVQVPFMAPDELSHFVDVRDVVAMHIQCANHPRASKEIFNCCAEHAIRGSEFAECVRELVPSAEVEFGYPWSMAQGGEIEFDMSKMKDLLGFVPRYTTRDAINHVFDWTQSGELVAPSRAAT